MPSFSSSIVKSNNSSNASNESKKNSSTNNNSNSKCFCNNNCMLQDKPCAGEGNPTNSYRFHKYFSTPHRAVPFFPPYPLICIFFAFLSLSSYTLLESLLLNCTWVVWCSHCPFQRTRTLEDSMAHRHWKKSHIYQLPNSPFRYISLLSHFSYFKSQAIATTLFTQQLQLQVRSNAESSPPAQHSPTLHPCPPQMRDAPMSVENKRTGSPQQRSDTTSRFVGHTYGAESTNKRIEVSTLISGPQLVIQRFLGFHATLVVLRKLQMGTHMPPSITVPPCLGFFFVMNLSTFPRNTLSSYFV